MPTSKPTPVSPAQPADLSDEVAPKNTNLDIVYVRDPNGHLLFCYNVLTDSIEIKDRRMRENRDQQKSIFTVAVSALRAAGRNVISDQPTLEVTATVKENGKAHD